MVSLKKICIPWFIYTPEGTSRGSLINHSRLKNLKFMSYLFCLKLAVFYPDFKSYLIFSILIKSLSLAIFDVTMRLRNYSRRHLLSIQNVGSISGSDTIFVLGLF